MATESPYAPFIRTLARGKRSRRSLERDEANTVFTGLLNDELTDSQLGALLMLLRVKEETPDELAGMVEATRSWLRQHQGPLPDVDLDWPSYSGKKKHHPWYLLAARVLADSGVRVLLHGGPAHTPNRLYTHQRLEALGIPSGETPDELARHLDRSNLVYMPLGQYSPAFARALMQREELGLRTPVNSVARSLNPAGAPVSVQAIFHPSYLDLHRQAARQLGDPRLLLFKGEGGEVEVRPDARTRGVTDTPEQTVPWSLPATLDRQTAPGEPGAEALTRLWQQDEGDYGREAVLQTLAVLLHGLGRACDFTEGRRQAEALWDNRDCERLAPQPFW